MATSDLPSELPSLPPQVDDANVGQSQAGLPAPADDADMIDSAWVSRVQHIMNTYGHNPHELVRQLSTVKAEYISQRYGVALKQGVNQE